MSDSATSHLHDDGRWHHRFRQSWLGDASICLERGRAVHAFDDERRESDAAGIGTSLHAAAEYGLREGASLRKCQSEALATFADLAALPNFVWQKYSPKKAKSLILQYVGDWYRIVRPTLDPQADLEVPFTVELYQDDLRVVEVEGTMDYFDGGVKDLKTSGRGPYTPWEKRRWDIQSHVYTFAAHELGWTDDDFVSFEWIVFHKDGVQRFDVERSYDDWEWLKQRSESFALLIEADLPVWPKVDNHALCSPKWCDHWDRCKGASIGKPW